MAQWRRSDWVLFSTILVMVCFGLVMVYSASSVMAELKYKWSAHFGVRQLAWAVRQLYPEIPHRCLSVGALIESAPQL